MTYDVYSEFDIDKHANTFINYLEIVISPDGKCYYAVPSHTQYLENILKLHCDICNIDYETFIKDYVYNWPNCLCDLTGYCMVWNTFMTKPSQGLTKAQIDTIYTLMTKHYTKIPSLRLYQGEL